MMHEDSPIGLPSLHALETFLRVADLGSLRRAARERGVEPSTISHAIRALEDALGTRLFHRSSRSIRLTEAGERLRVAAAGALGDLGAVVADIAQHDPAHPRGRLRLNVPRTVADLVVRPILGRFAAAFPEVRLEIVSDDGLVDIVAGGFDAGIRPGRRLAEGMIAVPVGPARRFAVVGAPGYLDRYGTPQHPQDLHRHLCIERSFPGGGRYAWEFMRDGEALEVEVKGNLVADDSALMLAAACDGLGLAFLHETYADTALAERRLVRVLEDWCPNLGRFHLYYPGRRLVPPPLRAFIETAHAFWKPVRAPTS